VEYIKIRWNHSLNEDPVLLYSEIDENRFEVRKLWVYMDGSVGYANSTESFGDVELSYMPTPLLEKIAAHYEFEVLETSNEEFENVWALRSKA
jgi:hypothetical protein